MWGDLGKLIVAKGFKKLSNVQKIALSGHTVMTQNRPFTILTYKPSQTTNEDNLTIQDGNTN